MEDFDEHLALAGVVFSGDVIAMRRALQKRPGRSALQGLSVQLSNDNLRQAAAVCASATAALLPTIGLVSVIWGDMISKDVLTLHDPLFTYAWFTSWAYAMIAIIGVIGGHKTRAALFSPIRLTALLGVGMVLSILAALVRLTTDISSVWSRLLWASLVTSYGFLIQAHVWCICIFLRTKDSHREGKLLATFICVVGCWVFLPISESFWLPTAVYSIGAAFCATSTCLMLLNMPVIKKWGQLAVSRAREEQRFIAYESSFEERRIVASIYRNHWLSLFAAFAAPLVTYSVFPAILMRGAAWRLNGKTGSYQHLKLYCAKTLASFYLGDLCSQLLAPILYAHGPLPVPIIAGLSLSRIVFIMLSRYVVQGTHAVVGLRFLHPLRACCYTHFLIAATHQIIIQNERRRIELIYAHRASRECSLFLISAYALLGQCAGSV